MAKFGLGNIMQGALGNFSEKTSKELTEEYREYLFDNEEIIMGYQLIRDALVFTNYRISFIDKQGATEKKTSFKTIHMETIVDVEMETAGFGIDDSEITITCMENIFEKSNSESLKRIRFEFPKKTNILPLYRYLGNLSLQNRNRINSN